MATRRVSKLTRSALAAIDAPKLPHSRFLLSRSRSSSSSLDNFIAPLSVAKIFGSRLVDGSSMASAKYLATIFTRNFHSTLPSRYSATASSSQVWFCSFCSFFLFLVLGFDWGWSKEDDQLIDLSSIFVSGVYLFEVCFSFFGGGSIEEGWNWLKFSIHWFNDGVVL